MADEHYLLTYRADGRRCAVTPREAAYIRAEAARPCRTRVIARLTGYGTAIDVTRGQMDRVRQQLKAAQEAR